MESTRTAVIGPEAQPVGQPSSLVPVSEVAAPESTAGRAREAASRADEAPEHIEPAPELLRGSVVLLDAAGAVVPRPNGTLKLISWRENARGGYGTHVDTPVVDGEWSVPLERFEGASHLGIDKAELDSEPAIIDSPADKLALPLSGPLEIRARTYPSSILHVVDASTGQDLSGISLLEASRWPREDDIHPGMDPRKRVLGRELTSPIDLVEVLPRQKRHGNRTLLVGATGHAWTSTEVDFRKGGVRHVELEPGGELEIQLVGHDPSSGSTLRFRPENRQQSRPILNVPLDGDDLVLLKGMGEGSLDASVEIGDWFENPVVLGRATVTVRAGALSRASIQLVPPPQASWARLEGRVFLPKEWGIERARSGISPLRAGMLPRIMLKLMGTPLEGFDDRQMLDLRVVEPSTRAGMEELHWVHDRVQVGRYELGLHEPSYSIVIEVPPEGLRNVVLEVPPPVELLVEVLDKSTGEPIETDALKWNSKRPVGVSGGSLEPAELDPDTGLLRILAPATETELMLWDWGYKPFSETVDLRPGPRRHTIRLEQAPQMEITLVDEGTAVPFPQSSHSRPTAVEGSEGRVTLSSTGSFKWVFQVSEPGTYVFEPPPIAGYAPLPEQRIDVELGKVTQHVIELERRP